MYFLFRNFLFWLLRTNNYLQLRHFHDHYRREDNFRPFPQHKTAMFDSGLFYKGIQFSNTLQVDLRSQNYFLLSNNTKILFCPKPFIQFQNIFYKLPNKLVPKLTTSRNFVSFSRQHPEIHLKLSAFTHSIRVSYVW